MTAPAFETASSAGVPTGATSLTIDKPTGTAEGDLLVAVISCVETPQAESGWTMDLSVSGDLAAVYYKLAGGSEPSTYTFDFGASSLVCAGGIIRISGAHQTTPVAAIPTSVYTGDGHPDPPSSGTVSSDDYLAVALFGNIGPALSSTPPSGYDERVDHAEDATITEAAVGIATKTLSAATTENPGAFTLNSASSPTFNAAWTILIAPGAGVTLHAVSPTDDITTTGWSSTPLWSRIDDPPDTPDGTVISATSS